MSDIQHIESHTPDLTAENVGKLAALFPDVLTEITDPQTGETKRAIDFDALRDKLGDVAEGTRERYQFTWPGKRAAKAEARKPISKTLRPVKERSKDWDSTQNLYIEGDNLDALKILRETYAGKIKLIYIDPPYNTGHDFIYKDNYGKTIAEDKAENGDWDDEGGQLVANPESNGRFHSDWCSMIYPRLLLARDLLTSDGVLCISIDDGEVSSLEKICNEIYGEQNFIALLTVIVKPEGRRYGAFAKSHEYIAVYAKDSNKAEFNEIEVEGSSYRFHDQNGGFNLKGLRNRNVQAFNSTNRPNLRYPFYVDSLHPDANGLYAVRVDPADGYEMVEASTIDGLQSVWRWGKEKARVQNDDLVAYRGNDGEIRIFQKERKLTQTPKTVWSSKDIISNKGTREVQELLGKGVFDFPKPVKLIEQLIEICTQKEDIVLDMFSGSATTADAVMQKNVEDQGARQFILIQLEEHTSGSFKTICDLGEERIRRAGEKIKAEVEAENAQGRLDGEVRRVPDIGFRVLRMDSSCYEDARKSPAEFSQGALDLDVDNTKEGRSSLDLLFECLPSFQLPYTSSIETLSGEPFDGHTVYSVNGGQLLACFDADIPESLIRGMADFDPKPSYVVVAEKSLPDSAARTNFAELFKQSANALDGQTQIRII